MTPRLVTKHWARYGAVSALAFPGCPVREVQVFAARVEGKWFHVLGVGVFAKDQPSATRYAREVLGASGRRSS